MAIYRIVQTNFKEFKIQKKFLFLFWIYVKRYEHDDKNSYALVFPTADLCEVWIDRLAKKKKFKKKIIKVIKKVSVTYKNKKE